MQPSENPKNPKNTPVDPLTSVGSIGDKENSSRAQNCFFSPQPLENLMIGGSNQVQRSSNFGEMKMMTSSTHPQKISTKFLTNKEESKEIGARTGFCEKLKNVKLKELVNPAGFALDKRVWIHYKVLKESLQTCAQEQSKRKRKSTQRQAHKVWN